VWLPSRATYAPGAWRTMECSVNRNAQDEAALLYDEDCAFCRWSADKVLAWDRRRRLRPVAIQSEEGQLLLDEVAEEMRLDSWHLALPSGEVRSAGDAAAPLAELLPGGRPLAFLFRTFPALTERAYRLISDNRGRLTKLLRIEPRCELRR
jgi:predicted DCC family thiol-disulfide oxidoreductase YuxK